MKTKLSVQAQLLHDPTRDLERLRQLQPLWVKYHQADPNRTRELLDMGYKVCLRIHSISEMQSELAANPQALGRQHGEFWINKLRREWGLNNSQIARVAVEGINEPSVASAAEASRVNVYGMAFADSAAQQGIRVATPNLSTGWPYNHGPDTPPDYEPFRGLVEALRRTGSYWASHEYCDRRGPDSDDWRWNMGRILQRPAWFRQSGVKILITECGYDQAVNAPQGTPHHSWNGHMSAAHYASNILGVYDYRMQADPDVESLMIFLLDTDNPGQWWTFNVDACWHEIVAHARWMEQQPDAPVTPPWPDRPDPPVIPPVITPPTSDLFERSMAFIKRWEGEYVNDPRDPGGETHWGISKRSYPNLDIKNLTWEQAKILYQRDYWQASGANQMSWPLCLIHMDTAVNAGVGRAREMLQRSDGNFLRYAGHLIDWYTRITNFEIYGRAWIRRRADILIEASR